MGYAAAGYWGGLCGVEGEGRKELLAVFHGCWWWLPVDNVGWRLLRAIAPTATSNVNPHQTSTTTNTSPLLNSPTTNSQSQPMLGNIPVEPVQSFGTHSAPRDPQLPLATLYSPLQAFNDRQHPPHNLCEGLPRDAVSVFQTFFMTGRGLLLEEG